MLIQEMRKRDIDQHRKALTMELQQTSSGQGIVAQLIRCKRTPRPTKCYAEESTHALQTMCMQYSLCYIHKSQTTPYFMQCTAQAQDVVSRRKAFVRILTCVALHGKRDRGQSTHRVHEFA